jgi:hypothetical protein
MQDKINFCLAETHKHVRKVQGFLNIFINDLINRGENHDNSKFEEPELTIFAENTERLNQVQYGSDEYKQCLEATKPAREHHYSRNDHHPEFHKNGIDDMDLMCIVEMLADWRAASERNKNGNIRKSIEINAEKYNMSPQLRRILENTVKRYF